MATRRWVCKQCGRKTTDSYGAIDAAVDVVMSPLDFIGTMMDGLMGGKGESSLSCQPPKCCDQYMSRDD